MMVHFQSWSLLKGVRFKANINGLSKREDTWMTLHLVKEIRV